jgi:hypothetical protein
LTSLNLAADGLTLVYSADKGRVLWSLSITDIVLVAEYTTDEGPAEDYFLVFVTRERGSVLYSTASFYADGREEILKVLANHWREPVELALASSTRWKSRIVWPPKLAEEEYFAASEIVPRGYSGRLRKAILGPTFEYVPSEGVRNFLREPNPN